MRGYERRGGRRHAPGGERIGRGQWEGEIVTPEAAVSSMTADIPPPTSVKLTTWLGFGMMCLGLFMAVLDIQIVATSLPTIRAALSIKADAMSLDPNRPI